MGSYDPFEHHLRMMSGPTNPSYMGGFVLCGERALDGYTCVLHQGHSGHHVFNRPSWPIPADQPKPLD